MTQKVTVQRLFPVPFEIFPVSGENFQQPMNSLCLAAGSFDILLAARPVGAQRMILPSWQIKIRRIELTKSCLPTPGPSRDDH